MKRTRTLLFLGLIAAFPAAAASPTEERQQRMKEMAASAKLIAQTFADKHPYDGAELTRAADKLAELGGKRLTALFPRASLGPPSRALPAIAADERKFAEIAADLERLAQALAQSFGRSPDRLTEDMRMGAGSPMGNPLLGAGRRLDAADVAIPAEHLFHMVLQTCTSCHAAFRQPGD